VSCLLDQEIASRACARSARAVYHWTEGGVLDVRHNVYANYPAEEHSPVLRALLGIFCSYCD